MTSSTGGDYSAILADWHFYEHAAFTIDDAGHACIHIGPTAAFQAKQSHWREGPPVIAYREGGPWRWVGEPSPADRLAAAAAGLVIEE